MIAETARRRTEIADLYKDIIAQTALLCMRDLFNGDRSLHAVGFNGHVKAIHPGTGEHQYPCIISVNVERESFPADENLCNVTPTESVKHLGAVISHHPFDVEPVQPILDFDLSKYAFVRGFSTRWRRWIPGRT